ncbi:MAG TPA: hypothetical protein VMG32_01950 [Anaeromyxobacteraceae bacterium]|nr:hypothetical protein [Anaeromyxobacteraceae bacterium]
MRARRLVGSVGRTVKEQLNPWEGGGGAAALVAALALWAWVLYGVAAPLGAALVRAEVARAPVPAAAATPDPGALAAAPGAWPAPR